MYVHYVVYVSPGGSKSIFASMANWRAKVYGLLVFVEDIAIQLAMMANLGPVVFLFLATFIFDCNCPSNGRRPHHDSPYL